jgi:catechol 2,3-dioxygenase-like lactoylglutathione lyase family enzyme
MSLLRRIAHVNISVHDIESARRFYGDTLGLAPAVRPNDAGRAGCWFCLGDAELHVSLEPNADNVSSKRHVAFEVSDLAALRARLQAAGCAIEEGRPLDGMQRFFARDPAGNRLEFYERTA